MAVKKKKSRKQTRKVKSESMNEIIGIAVTAVGVLLALSVYVTGKVGLFGELIKNVLTGFFGAASYLFPVMVIALGLIKVFRNKRNASARIIYVVFLIVILSSIIHTGHYSKEQYENLSPINCVVMFYNQGNSMSGGGVIGGIVSIPFILLFKPLGTVIILASVALIDIVLLTDISLANALRKLKDYFIRLIKKLGSNVKNSRSKYPAELSFESFERIDDLKPDDSSENRLIDFTIEKKKRTAIKIEGLNKKEQKTDNEAVMPEQNVSKHEIFYRYPPYNLLNKPFKDEKDIRAYKEEIMNGAAKIEETLKSFGVSVRVTNVSRGPTVTRYEVQPNSGVKVSRIVNLADDISLNMASAEVRIEAPIPGKAAIGIEVPNKKKEPVFLREILESNEFRKHPSKLAFAMGKNISGECMVSDISKMPHLLVAGATGAGKSVCINNIIMSILFKTSPEEVRMLLIDPKIVELKVYNGIPHMLVPVVTDPKKAASALSWAVQEMVERYKLFSERGARDLTSYNKASEKSEDEEFVRLPQIIIIIDELSDLMMVAPNEVEDAICRLAQMARAAGMHIVIATQRPSVDVITGVIKANIPSRISFSVSSQVDSRTILDTAGAEKLLGKGDMLFYPVGEPKPVRLQGALVTEEEVEKVVEFLKRNGKAEYDDDIIDEIESETSSIETSEDNDELLPQAIETVIDAGQASISLIQRKYRVGYARAARMIDQMETRGIIGGFEGSKPRQVLISRQQWLEMADHFNK